MHNGQIGHFDRLRRGLEARLDDVLYAQKLGSTDSELIFLLMMQHGLDDDPAQALAETVAAIVAEADRARCTGVHPAHRRIL